MTPKLFVRLALLFVAVGAFTATLSAQAGEVYVNAGYFWPGGTNAFGDYKNEGIYGIKAGGFLTPNFSMEGGFSYMNHFEQKNGTFTFTPTGGLLTPSVMNFLYDINGAYNFGSRNFFGARVSPYVTLGIGGMTTEVRHADSILLTGGFTRNPATGAIFVEPGPSVRLQDGDTFFTFNYGGGIKALNLWGPVGLRADIRGRTVPNYFGETMTWPELTGGLTFSWGER